MKRNLLLSFLAIFVFAGAMAQSSLWQETSQDRIAGLAKKERGSMPTEFKLYALDLAQLKSQLQSAPSRHDGAVSNVIMPFPDADGKMSHYRIYEASVMHPELAARYPEIGSYVGQGVEDPSVSIRFSVTLFGLHVMRFGTNGTSYIDPYTSDNSRYIVYEKRNLPPSTVHQCLVEDEPVEMASRMEESLLANDGIFRIYRLAMASTVEYSTFHVNAAGVGSGTTAQKKAAVLAAMNVTMTRINGIYERDMSLTMQLVPNNDAIIFITTDSFSNDDAGQLINQSQSVIDATIGPANYDIGHTVSTGGGGLAQSPSVCLSGKARGITGSPSPVGDAYDIDFVAHEIGHQFGASHTFNGIGGNCTTGTRAPAYAVEPGSGSTIMAYAGICSAVDVQPNSDDHFHAVSIGQMMNHVQGAGGCSTNVPNNNTPPVVNAGPNYTIPNGTAFILKGTASDVNGDVLTYCWEQTNTEISPTASSSPSPTNTVGPNFRSNSPSISPNRYMPNLQSVLDGNLAPTWEVIPTVARSMNFALTVRDNRTPNGGQTNRDDMTVTFASVGPFKVTSPSVENVTWIQGTTQTVTWDVAGTTANGINTSNVNILLSTDGGLTFSTVLAANTANDGSETITVPNVAAPYCRIMIEPVGNIYYAVSKSIAIGYTVEVVNTCNTYTANPGTPIAAQNPPAWQILGSVTVPVNSVISDMNVSVNITHPRINDLYIGLLPPGATTVGQIRILYQQGCSSFFTAGMNTTFDDEGLVLSCPGIAAGNSYKPLNTLSFFDGQNSQGDWRLVIADVAPANNGTLNSFSVEICSTTTTVTLDNPQFGLQDFALYPNPNNGSFTVGFTSNTASPIKISVHDMRGRRVFESSYPNNGLFSQDLQLDNLLSGIYLVTVQDGDRKEVKRIVVE